MYCKALLFVLLLLAMPVKAADEYYSVVNVDVTDVSAAVAKEKAMAQANRQALYQVAPRLTSEEGVSLLHSLTNDQIAYFIKSVTVLSEKSSDVRYIASLKIIIADEILRQYLEEKGMTEQQPRARVDVLYVFSDLVDWLKVEKTIKALKNVDDIQTVAMTRKKVQFRVDYSGDIEVLQQYLSQAGLSLRAAENIYLLKKQSENAALDGE